MSFFKLKLKLKKIARWLHGIGRKISITLSFPHIWMCIIIFLSSIFSLIISLYLNHVNLDYWSSIFANLSAGLVTGVVICLISSIKQISIIKMQQKKEWLQKLSEMLSEYYLSYNKVSKLKFDKFSGDEETFNLIYMTGAKAKWVNDEILLSSSSKILSFNTIRYCKKILGYDAQDLCCKNDILYGYLYALDCDYPSSTTMLHYFQPVDHELRKLSTSIHLELTNLDIRLSEIQKCIL